MTRVGSGLHGPVRESPTVRGAPLVFTSYLLHNQYDRKPQYARLGGNQFWVSDVKDVNPWIQVDLGSNHTVTGLQTAGNSKQLWAEQIKVEVGVTKGNLMFVVDNNGQPKVCLRGHNWVHFAHRLWCTVTFNSNFAILKTWNYFWLE